MTKIQLEKDGLNNTIPVSIAKKMTAAFRESQKADEGTFTEAAWLPAVQIKKLAEKVAEFEGDGARIYFARYTKEIIDSINKLQYGDKVPDTYCDMNTILIVVTKVIDGKPRTDYFIDKSVEQEPICDDGGPNPTDPENRLDLCPSVCDDGSELMKP
ncbi:hypothetical protein QWY86_12390 [Pedobacter aquatilis]|uniref:hypothetical protein n=1 Tax=Pedobacter aquatilis TaxID=351343 RepID=UPI0025B541A2|nr:hypothetical protein [Pedobacter aquatilis]MDN3587475.1 hypothetical protein [Pedobacter aquatilis]